MSKADVIDALMESATRTFAREGYGGTSLRDVAADAGVPLSSIHTYFGSKRSLYDEVCRRAWNVITEERKQLLAKAAEEASDGMPSIRAIVYALARPVVSRTLGSGGDDCDTVRIIRQSAMRQNTHGGLDRFRRTDDNQVHYIKCIAQVYPKARWTEIVWAYSFIIGVIYSWQVTDRLFDNLQIAGRDANIPKLGNSTERICRGIVEFCAAGVDACYASTLIEYDIAAHQLSAA